MKKMILMSVLLISTSAHAWQQDVIPSSSFIACGHNTVDGLPTASVSMAGGYRAVRDFNTYPERDRAVQRCLETSKKWAVVVYGDICGTAGTCYKYWVRETNGSEESELSILFNWIPFTGKKGAQIRIYNQLVDDTFDE